MGKSLQLKTLTVILIVAAILALSGCTTKTTDPIIGTWQADDMPGLTLTFTDKNSTAYANGTAQLNWNDTGTYYGIWRSWGNGSYFVTFAWSDPEHKNVEIPPFDAHIKYDHGIICTTISRLSTFHHKGLGLQMPGSH